MAGPSNRPYAFTDPIYSVIDLDALPETEAELAEDDEQRMRSPASSAPSSRPSSRGRGDRQQARQQKRREQNKAAQRSFRARKEQHLSELLNRIESLELRKKNIEDENQVLMHELLRKRAENNLLRSRRASQVFTSSTPRGNLTAGGSQFATLTRHVSIPESGETTDMTVAEGKRPMRDLPIDEEPQAPSQPSRATPNPPSRNLPVETLMWLYGPFLDVWKLVKEQPAVGRGDVSVDEVLDRLKEMARYEEAASQRPPVDRSPAALASVQSTRHRARSL